MPTRLPINLERAIATDAAEIAALRCATAERLTTEFGDGPWSCQASEKGVLFAIRNSRVFIAKRRGKILATLALQTKKPWAIDRKYFTPVQRPLYLTAMAVATERQRAGLGRACMDALKKIVKAWPADAVRLDAYDAAAGAGPFYEKCGYRKVGRASFRGTPLVYFEMLL